VDPTRLVRLSPTGQPVAVRTSPRRSVRHGRVPAGRQPDRARVCAVPPQLHRVDRRNSASRRRRDVPLGRLQRDLADGARVPVRRLHGVSGPPKHARAVRLTVQWGPMYKISYDLAYDYRKFIVRSTCDSDLKRAEISLGNIVS